MRLSDIYGMQRAKAPGWKKAIKFFDNPDTHYAFSRLNYLSPPPWSAVALFQKQCAQEIQVSLEAERIVNKINNDKLHNPKNMMFDIEKHIKLIEDSLSWEDKENGKGGLTGLRDIAKTKGLTANDIRGYLNVHTGLIQQLTLAYNNLKQYDFENFGGGTQQAFLAFERAYKSFDAICKQLRANSSENFAINSNESFLQPLIWAGNILKGALLEIEGTEFFEKNMPTNIKVVNSGALHGTHYNISGQKSSNSKKIIEDFLFFNMDDIDQSIVIEFKIGKEGKIQQLPIMEFLEFVDQHSNKNGNIVLIDSSEEMQDYYQTLTSQAITGATAKSGEKGMKFQGNVTPSQALAGWSSTNTYIFILKSLMLLVDPTGPYQSKRILGTDATKGHEYYDVTFSYALSKKLNQIIGMKNEIFLGRKGVVTIKQFLIERLGEYVIGPYTIASSHINIRTDRGVPVGLTKI